MVGNCRMFAVALWLYPSSLSGALFSVDLLNRCELSHCTITLSENQN